MSISTRPSQYQKWPSVAPRHPAHEYKSIKGEKDTVDLFPGSYQGFLFASLHHPLRGSGGKDSLLTFNQVRVEMPRHHSTIDGYPLKTGNNRLWKVEPGRFLGRWKREGATLNWLHYLPLGRKSISQGSDRRRSYADSGTRVWLSDDWQPMSRGGTAEVQGLREELGASQEDSYKSARPTPFWGLPLTYRTIRTRPQHEKMAQWVACHTAWEPESDLWHPYKRVKMHVPTILV